ncbi:DUF1810 domain-containing protein [Siccirubricoccus phaeus]|uniref:DUF1810 domain-containing protein n=1 Tax=Siccirubricoccus phaeus TaxID=2595053 RepID=UPI0011F1C34D|nr:DUF1810 domain-containing protein [Siccirubricoccus phaeus]
MSDAGLERFATAQAPVLEAVKRELAAGRKTSHWMWFVFPQLRALGRSPTALHYGLADLAEARAWLAHPVLGKRLEECTRLVLGVRGRSLHEIFGSPDDMKFRSCMTLFAAAAPSGSVFEDAIAGPCGGERDKLTLDLLARGECG